MRYSCKESLICLILLIQITAGLVDPDHGRGRRIDGVQNFLQDHPVDVQALFVQLIVDQASRTVTFRGTSCCLGNTLMFRLIERLARRPNTFVSFDRLIRDVWDGDAKSDEAIRSVVKELRARLRKSGLRRLASAIAGQRRAYALILRQ